MTIEAMNVTIIGAGYVGLVTGVGIAGLGHQVTFVELRDDRREALAAGRVPIEEPGLGDAYRQASDRLGVARTLDEAGTGDLVLIAVGTPVGEGGRSDIGQLEVAAQALAAHPDAHVCVRSTLPPGLSVRLPRMFGRADGRRLSTNPEFLRQGEALKDTAAPTRIVFGRFPETEPGHLARVEALYSGIDAPRLTVSVSAAELIKNLSNAFLALKLSFVNEVAGLAEEYGVEVDEILEGMSLDPRIGRLFMRPGLGFGGSCLPKELEVVATAGRRRSLAMHVARAASTVNADQQARFAARVLRELGPGATQVGMLGLSFKAGTDDLRGSPALGVVRELIDAGIRVVGHDPVVQREAALRAVPDLLIARTPAEAASGSDAIIVGTEWPEYQHLDWSVLARRLTRRTVFDGRNLLDPDEVTAAGLVYIGVGRRRREPAASQ